MIDELLGNLFPAVHGDSFYLPDPSAAQLNNLFCSLIIQYVRRSFRSRNYKLNRSFQVLFPHIFHHIRDGILQIPNILFGPSHIQIQDTSRAYHGRCRYIYNIGTTVLNGGISMVIFFFVNKIIFPESGK